MDSKTRATIPLNSSVAFPAMTDRDFRHSPDAKMHIPLNRSLGFLVNGLARLMRTELENRLRPHGLTPTMWSVLVALHEVESPSQTDLARATFLDGATVTRTLDILEAKEYLERHRGDNDRRVQNVALTDKGREMTGIINQFGNIVNNDATCMLTTDDRVQFEETIRRLIGHLLNFQNNVRNNEK